MCLAEQNNFVQLYVTEQSWMNKIISSQSELVRIQIFVILFYSFAKYYIILQMEQNILKLVVGEGGLRDGGCGFPSGWCAVVVGFEVWVVCGGKRLVEVVVWWWRWCT